MSGTKKTRPLYVRIADRADTGVGVKEHHDHLDGKECDLPGSPTDAIKRPQTSCYYHFQYVGKGLCGCPMCVDKFGRKKKNRKQRYSVKYEVKERLADSE